MVLQNLCFAPSHGVFIAVTDVGTFSVPRRMGGWAQRQLAPNGRSINCQTVPDAANVARFLGMVSGLAQRMSGCNCKGRR